MNQENIQEEIITQEILVMKTFSGGIDVKIAFN